MAYHLTQRGKTCIDIFGLNIRDQLVRDRKRAISEVRAQICKIVLNAEDSEEAKQELIAIRQGKRSYSMASNAVLDELEDLLEPIFE